MKVKILKRSAVNLGARFVLVNPGEVHDLPDDKARLLIGDEAAEAVDEPKN